ncbi:MAG: methylenetetrahydrofolate reductase [NAD(P)H] [Gammaproteobacteria bacterium]
MESQKHYTPTYSFEFFPPKTEEGAARLRETRDKLATLNPRFFSVTFGAGGSTQERTVETVEEIHAAGFEAAPHLSCIGSTRENIACVLAKYQSIGIRHIVALRGDIPSGMGRTPGEFRYANELVEFIRSESDDYFHIEVAAYPEFHPQAPNAQIDLENFKRKVEAGADSAITQYFFNLDAYLRFVDSCEKMGLTLPVVPGIMPITNYTQLARFSDMCGTEIPRWLRKRLEALGDDREAISELGLDVITSLCNKLLEAGAPGLHFYTMNRAEPTIAIWKRLGLN